MNRHTDDLSDFFDCVQAALNRNGHKPDLATLTLEEIKQKLFEEWFELRDALDMWLLQYPDERNPQEVEREAADLAVCALAAWMWARRGGRGAKPGEARARNYHLGGGE